MSIRKLAILPLIALFISCTVTKRVHRPGFHVQWRKIERTQSPETAEKQTHQAESLATRQETQSQFDRTTPVQNHEVEMNFSLETTSIDSTESVQNNSIKQPFPVEEESKLESVFKTKNTLAKSKSQSSARPIFWRMSAKSLRNLGIFFMCLGGMFLFASLLVYLGAFSGGGGSDSGGGGGAWLNFFLDLISISEWFWILIFIVVFILVSYLFFLLVLYVLGGPAVGVIVGLVFLALGILFFTLGKRREIEP